METNTLTDPSPSFSGSSVKQQPKSFTCLHLLLQAEASADPDPGHAGHTFDVSLH